MNGKTGAESEINGARGGDGTEYSYNKKNFTNSDWKPSNDGVHSDDDGDSDDGIGKKKMGHVVMVGKLVEKTLKQALLLLMDTVAMKRREMMLKSHSVDTMQLLFRSKLSSIVSDE